MCGGRSQTTDRTGTVLSEGNLVHNSCQHLQRLQYVVYGPYQVSTVETQRVGGSGEVRDEPTPDQQTREIRRVDGDARGKTVARDVEDLAE